MSPVGPSPNPNIPSEYCSTIPPLQQARAAGTLNSPPPTVMVPVSVLKHPNNDGRNAPKIPKTHALYFTLCNLTLNKCSIPGCPREQKRVWFADGILPNGEVADTSKLSVPSRRDSQEFTPDQSAVRRHKLTPTSRLSITGSPGNERHRNPFDFSPLQQRLRAAAAAAGAVPFVQKAPVLRRRCDLRCLDPGTTPCSLGSALR